MLLVKITSLHKLESLEGNHRKYNENYKIMPWYRWGRDALPDPLPWPPLVVVGNCSQGHEIGRACSAPQAAELRKAGSAPHLGNKVELALVAETTSQKGIRARELALLLASYGTGQVSQNSAEELTLTVWVLESWQDDQLRYLPGPYPGSELAHPNIYHVIIHPMP